MHSAMACPHGLSSSLSSPLIHFLRNWPHVLAGRCQYRLKSELSSGRSSLKIDVPDNFPPKEPDSLRISNFPASHTGHIRLISLNSPHNRNALSQQLVMDLNFEIERIRAGLEIENTQWRNGVKNASLGAGVRVLIFGSDVDNVFCAGADLKERKKMTQEQYAVPICMTTNALRAAIFRIQLRPSELANMCDRTHDFLKELRLTFTNIKELPIPTISAISSTALGGGLELALSTDFRVFSHATQVGLPETRLGIIPGAGGTIRLPRLIGTSRALDMVLTGRRVGGQEALDFGLCNRICGPSKSHIDEKELDDALVREMVTEGALEMAKNICKGGPGTTGPAMKAVKSRQWIDEFQGYNDVVQMEDRNEALRAFAEKRKPFFSGR